MMERSMIRSLFLVTSTLIRGDLTAQKKKLWPINDHKTRNYAVYYLFLFHLF